MYVTSMNTNISPVFLTVCLNPTMQKTLILPDLSIGQVNRCINKRMDASGKGVNVTRVLKQLGAQVIHITQLGGFLKEQFLKKTAEDLLTLDWTESDSEIRFCYTLLNRKNNTTTEIVEEGDPVSAKTEQLIRDTYSSNLDTADFIVISGSKAAGFSDFLFPDMVRQAKEQGKFVILDYRGKDLISSLPFKPDIIKPNVSEFLQTFLPEIPLREEDSLDIHIPKIKQKMIDLYISYDTKTILTNGSLPALSFDGSTFTTSTPKPVNPVNTIGSGDAFTAGMAWKLSQGNSLDEAVAFGHICGSKNAGLLRPGVIA